MSLHSFFPRKIPVFYGDRVTFDGPRPALTYTDGALSLEFGPAQAAHTGQADAAHDMLLVFGPLWASLYIDGVLEGRITRPDMAAPYQFNLPEGIPLTPGSIEDALTRLPSGGTAAQEERAQLAFLKSDLTAAHGLLTSLPESDTRERLQRYHMRQHFAAAKDTAIKLALKGDREVALGHMATALEAIPTHNKNARGKRVPGGRIAILADLSLPQCKHYRVEQKAEQFLHLGLRADIFEIADDENLLAGLARYDLLIVYRLPLTPRLAAIISAANDIGLPLAYETDDMLFDAAVFPGPRHDYAVGFGDLEYAELQITPALHAAAMAHFDHIIVSTRTLAAEVQASFPNAAVHVHPNALDGRHLNATKGDGSNDFTLFYGSGTKAHQQDLETFAADVLAPTMRKHARVMLTLAGHMTLPEALNGLEDRVIILPPQGLEAYWAQLAAAQFNLAPLSRTRLTDTKSAIKWLEAANFGVPTAATDSPAFSDVITDGTDGYLCSDAVAWRSALDRAISDPVAAQKAGALARDRAAAQFSPIKAAENLAAILKEIGVQ